TERYTVIATADGNPSGQTMRGAMLQTLLQDRFALRLHRETRDVDGYALVAANGGPKLPPHKDTGCFKVDITRTPVELPAPGQALCGDGGHRKSANDPTLVADLNGVTMRFLASFLGAALGQAVDDQTHVAGVFDFQFEYAPTQSMLDAMPAGA